MSWDEDNTRPRGMPGTSEPYIDQGGVVRSARDVLRAGQTAPGSPASGGMKKDPQVNIKQFPPHLFTREGMTTVRLMGIAYTNPTGGPANGRYRILSYTATQGQAVRFTHYRLWVSSVGVLDTPVNGGSVFPSYEFIPEIDQARILTTHGLFNGSYYQLSPFMTTMPRNTIALNVGGGFDSTVLDPYEQCQVYLAPGKTLTWDVSGGLTINRHMGVEMIGYVDTSDELLKYPQSG